MSKFTEWKSKTYSKFKLRQRFLLFWTFEKGSSDVTSPDLMLEWCARRSETGQEYLLIFGITKRVDVFWKSCRNREMRVWNGIASESGDHYHRLIDEYDQNGSQE